MSLLGGSGRIGGGHCVMVTVQQVLDAQEHAAKHALKYWSSIVNFLDKETLFRMTCSLLPVCKWGLAIRIVSWTPKRQFRLPVGTCLEGACPSASAERCPKARAQGNCHSCTIVPSRWAPPPSFISSTQAKAWRGAQGQARLYFIPTLPLTSFSILKVFSGSPLN